MSPSSITHVRRKRRLAPVHPSLPPEQMAQAIALEFAFFDFEWFPSHQSRYESTKYKADLKRMGLTRPLYEYVQSGELPSRSFRIRRVRALLKIAAEHIVQAFHDTNLSVEDVADAFEHIPLEKRKDVEGTFWEEIIDPPFEPLYAVAPVEVDLNYTETFTPAQALFVLTDQLAQLYECAERDYCCMNSYIDIGQVSFEDDVLGSYVRQRTLAEQDRTRLAPWYLATRYGAPLRKWRRLYDGLQLILDSRAGEKQFAGLRANDLFGALVKVETSAKH